MNSPSQHPGRRPVDIDTARLDYEVTASHYKELHETRFRLLALLPIVAGVAITLVPEHTSPNQHVALGALGVIATVGLTIYDQRNTQIYDRLVKRGRLLERLMGYPPMQLPPNDHNRKFGGAFADRPDRRKVFGVPVIWHDLALSLVYSAALSAWVFVLGDGILRHCPQLSPARHVCLLFSFAVTTWLATFLILIALAHQNDDETERISAWVDNQPTGNSGHDRPNTAMEPSAPTPE